MKVSVDTNVLVRVLIRDDRHQTAAAEAALTEADRVVVTLATLCEVSWVLSKGYRLTKAELASVFRHLLRNPDIEVERSSVQAGLRMLDAGGDFSDGVIAHNGRVLGAREFLSFDRMAVRLLNEHGENARLLS